jgi:hypothetical protein
MGVWHGLPTMGRSPDAAASAAQSRRRRNKQTVLAVLGVVVLGAASYAGVRLWENFTQSLANIGNGIGQAAEKAQQSIESAGSAANAAGSVTASQPPGTVSVSVLNADLPKYKWVDGSTNVPYSSLRTPIVGVDIVGTDIETAVQSIQGSCSYGFTITSNTDPLIAEDHLPGPGTYSQYVYQAPQCIADQAPTSGWQTWAPISVGRIGYVIYPSPRPSPAAVYWDTLGTDQTEASSPCDCSVVQVVSDVRFVNG